MTTFLNANYFTLNVFLTLRGNNGWVANPGVSVIQGILGPTTRTLKQGGAPVTFTFMFNTDDWGSGASLATSITAGIAYYAEVYDSSGTLLTNNPADWALFLLGANNSFYQPLLEG